jgi:hypothetical protein
MINSKPDDLIERREPFEHNGDEMIDLGNWQAYCLDLLEAQSGLIGSQDQVVTDKNGVILDRISSPTRPLNRYDIEILRGLCAELLPWVKKFVE